MLMVMSRVRSPTLRGPRPRSFQPSCACAMRSAGFIDPSLGGTVMRSGPITLAMSPIQASQRGIASASFLENLADLVVVALGVVGEEHQRPAVGPRLEVRAHREHLVAVPVGGSRSRMIVSGIRLITYE